MPGFKCEAKHDAECISYAISESSLCHISMNWNHLQRSSHDPSIDVPRFDKISFIKFLIKVYHYLFNVHT